MFAHLPGLLSVDHSCAFHLHYFTYQSSTPDLTPHLRPPIQPSHLSVFVSICLILFLLKLWQFLYFAPLILTVILRFTRWKVIINGWTVNYFSNSRSNTLVSHTRSLPVTDKHTWTYSFSPVTRIHSPLASGHKKKGDILQPCDTEYPSFVYEPSVKETNSIIKCGHCQK